MDVKQYLLQIERLDKAIKNKVDEILRLNTITTSITVAPKDVNIQTSSDLDRVGTSVARIIDLQKEVDELTNQLYDLKEKTKGMLKKLSKKEYIDILYKRYFNYKSIYQIAVDSGNNYRRMKRIHNQALLEFEKILDIVAQK